MIPHSRENPEVEGGRPDRAWKTKTKAESKWSASGPRDSCWIVDDDPIFISQLTTILLERGYLVLGAADGEAALDLLNQHELNFTLAIVDVFPEE